MFGSVAKARLALEAVLWVGMYRSEDRRSRTRLKPRNLSGHTETDGSLAWHGTGTETIDSRQSNTLEAMGKMAWHV